MELSVALASGAFFGLLGCLAPALLFERALRGDAQISLAAGIAAVGVSFLTLTVVLLVVYTATNAGFLEFGCAMVGSFLLFWGVESIRVLRAAHKGSRDRGEGQA